MKVTEKSVQDTLERHYLTNGYVVKREVVTPVGYIDLILYKNMGYTNREKILIEVKEYRGIKHAIGQLYSYANYHRDLTKLRCIYFDRNLKNRSLDASYESFTNTGNPYKDIEFRSINNLVDITTIKSKAEESKTTNNKEEVCEVTIVNSIQDIEQILAESSWTF